MFGQRHCKTPLQDISQLEEKTDLMSKPQDGFVSRFLNRPISRRITSVLLKFPIHPSTWTISICVLPLIAGVFLIRGVYVSMVIGAAIFRSLVFLMVATAKSRAPKTWNQSSGKDWITC